MADVYITSTAKQVREHGQRIPPDLRATLDLVSYACTQCGERLAVSIPAWNAAQELARQTGRTLTLCCDGCGIDKLAED